MASFLGDERGDGVFEDVSVALDLGEGRRGAHEGHVVKGRQENSPVHQREMEIVLAKRYSQRAPS